VFEPAVANHVSLTGIALFEAAGCEFRPAGQMISLGYEISLQDHCTRNIFASSTTQSCPISSILMLPPTTSNNAQRAVCGLLLEAYLKTEISPVNANCTTLKELDMSSTRPQARGEISRLDVIRLLRPSARGSFRISRLT